MDNTNVIESTAVPGASQMNLATVLRIPAVRQVTLLVGVAAAVAAGFAIAFWSQSASYTQLYSGSVDEAAEMADALRASGIEFKIDTGSGALLVPESSLYEARMRLAEEGIPQGAASMGALAEQSSFGVSQFMENARYQHALEGELARTISSMGSVREARVHLVIPKQSAFIRDQKGASASVLLQLFRGRALEPEQATAIVNLVAGSVPELATKNVTIIDQHGRLLTSGETQTAGARAATQFKFTRQLEDTYTRRIEDLLTPLVGAGRVRAQVVADLDFTFSEETRESFDPARAVVRSEFTSENIRRDGDGIVAGVPGALSNQPPEAGLPDGVNTEAEDAAAKNESRSSTRNFEVDRTISHTRPQAGSIRRLSIAVLIDDSPIAAAEGEQAAQPSVTDQDIARYTALVREAVGFNEARGDTVVVMNETFRNVEVIEEAEPPAIWERPVVREVARQGLGAILVLAIAFGVVRPMLRGVLSSNAAVSGEYLAAGSGGSSLAATAIPGGGAVSAAALGGPNYEEKVAAAKNITGHDPARVAQVVRKWVTVDE